MSEPWLFSNRPDDPIGHTDPKLPSAARPRLKGQDAAVLARLREGSATNVELERISKSRRINSRIADVRRWLQQNEKKTITSKALNVASGLYSYRIEDVQGEIDGK